MHFEIWEELWPTNQVVDVINRYKGFFLPTRNAHLDRFIIKVSNVVSNDSRSPSFYRAFRMVAGNPDLAPSIDVRPLRKRLSQHKKVLNSISNYRNTKAAHWDTTQVAIRKPVLFGDSKRMMKDLQNIFNEICGAATNGVWSFNVVQHGDTATLLSHLNELGKESGQSRPTKPL